MRPDQIMKLLGVKPDGSLSLRTSPVESGVQVLSQGVVVGWQYLVAANTVGYVVVGLSLVGGPDDN